MSLRWSWNDGWLLNMDGVLETDLASSHDDSMGCKYGSKSLQAQERLNDELGASACSASKCNCRNIGSAPKLVLASRVDDSICGMASNCYNGSDEKQANCVDNTCGGAVKEASGNSKEGLDLSVIWGSGNGAEAISDQQKKKKSGEGLVRKRKGVVQNCFAWRRSNFHNKVICMK